MVIVILVVTLVVCLISAIAISTTIKNLILLDFDQFGEEDEES